MKKQFTEKELLEKLDNEARFRHFSAKTIWKWVISILSIGLAAYQLYTAYFNIFDTLRHRALHTGVIVALVFLLYPISAKVSRSKLPWYDIVLAILALTTTIYIFLDYDGIINRMFIYSPNNSDLFFATLLIVLVIEGGRRIVGNALTILTIIFLLYAYFGNYLPSFLKHNGKSLKEILTYMYLTTEGIYGTAIGVSATYIVLFILFGAFLSKSGMGQLINDIALSIAGNKSGGPAKVAVLASGLLGTVNGSALANVVTTGTFTIPLMKKVGYKPEFAGAVEASASVGGQIIPPVMGAAAFIMAETLGLSYFQIAIAALLPGILYYLGILVVVHLRAKKDNLVGIAKSELPSLSKAIKERGLLLLPLIALVYLIFSGKTPIFSALITIILTVVVSWLSKSTRMGIKDILVAMENGIRATLSVAMSCALVGIIVGVITLTGLGAKLTQSILFLGGGTLFFTLFFTMIASIIMGMGLPSIPTYIITSTMAAPALLKLGIPPLVSHMFVFYFGIFANLTPPVALAAYAGAGIANANPNKTGWIAVKLALAGFIIPFMFVYSPELLLQNISNWWQALWISITSIIGVISLGVAVEGYLFTTVNKYLRIMLAFISFLLIDPGIWTDLTGIILLLPIFWWQNKQKNSAKKIEVELSKLGG